MTRSAPVANHVLGVVLSFMGYGAWACTDALAKLAGETLPVAQIMALNFSVGVPVALGAALAGGGVRQIRTGRPFFHVMRWFLVTGWVAGCVAGVKRLPLADYYTIVFSAPFMIAVLGHFFLKERVTRGIALAIILGFAGVLFAVRFSSMESEAASFPGVIYTFFGAVCMAGAVLMVRACPDESHYALTFWSTLGVALGSLGWLFMFDTAVFDGRGIFFALLSGIAGAAGSLLTNASLRLAPAAIVAPYQYFQIAVGGLLGYLVWASVPAWPMLVGAFLVIVSGLYILLQVRVEQQKVVFSEWDSFIETETNS